MDRKVSGLYYIWENVRFVEVIEATRCLCPQESSILLTQNKHSLQKHYHAPYDARPPDIAAKQAFAAEP